ncbi:MAG TPA: TonB-dependent receptor [Blastocatellia bacterium]|nr:TonB-dependent receptor [Blastocatellia bacterium]
MSRFITFTLLLIVCASTCLAQQAEKAATSEKQNVSEKPIADDAKPADVNKRVELNMLGKTDSASGESRRNENVQFNLVDNGALKELNVRLGTTATIIREFNPASNYFGSEFGNAPRASMALPATLRTGFHGQLYESHLNSVFSARSFFQVGSVKPARENDYGFNAGFDLSKRTKFFLDASQQKIRGSVNGNVLVPRPDERIPLDFDPVTKVPVNPATKALVAKFLAAYPKELPNRTDINPRALNTNALQSINNTQVNLRLDDKLSAKDSLAVQYQFTNQHVDAFQLVAGQNPDTDTKSHLARMAWTRAWDAKTVTTLLLSYDRLSSLLQPEENAVGPYVSPSGLTSLGPDGAIPLDRAQNQIRAAAQLQRVEGGHTLAFGVGIVRRQINGRETDVHRGFFSFSNDFGTDAVTNFRLGRPSQYIGSIGNTHRGFRLWEANVYAGDKWQLSPRLNLQYGVRWQPVTKPIEVNDLNQVPYDSDWNNVAPTIGFAYRLPNKLGVFRGAYGTHFGEIFFVSYQQIRFSPPRNNKVVVVAPESLLNPFQGKVGKPTVYALDPELATPYSHQYNLSWEPEWNKKLRLQLGYVGSRSHKLLVLWYLNRAHPVADLSKITTATVNDRRPNPDIADYRLTVNGSQGYFDAARVSLVLPNWHGLTVDSSYWFSKAIDLGSSYTNTANENDSRKSRSQSEAVTHPDMKGLSDFDQTHAFLVRTSYAIKAPKFSRAFSAFADGWNFSTVVLVKTGIPFNISAGSDGPGFGNVDGNGGDRPILLDPSILGRTIANPDTSRQLLPRSAFRFMKVDEIVALGERGSLGRNVFRKGPIHNVNAQLSRSWAFKHDLRLTFRAESVNLFNTPQFAEPGFELANPNFGAITNTLNDGRTFKFTVQLGW